MSGQGSKYCDGSLCERKSFPADYAAACHLDPGPCWPISNSQGYFQLIIHLCHLDTYHRDGLFFDLQDTTQTQKIQKRSSFYDIVNSKSDFKIPTLQTDFRPPLFATDGAEQRSPSIEPQ